ncbi:DUF3322 and DUF2220 domain-containing protein [Thalassotalea euphylliae]|uniref:DUF3322 and DUF2220 domain-containing protein n=1 Tax=Thalassotalea euphylliae TaxID=1655234 RepID=A0A3E0TLD4_9GAMM|nr:DUF3322 and DUF2220 domain-containing protein [Thalassotalea euphylliae]REL25369.1 DUF3322 and DUF2220 domain-containing protein [Thalassotalea euphylliae]
MPALISSKAIKAKLLKQWQKYYFHLVYLASEQGENEPKQLFPLTVRLTVPTGRQLLHEYQQVQGWLADMATFDAIKGFTLVKQDISYQKMGRQRMPNQLLIDDLESLARWLGQWQAWQRFDKSYQQVKKQMPMLLTWLVENPGLFEKYLDVWPQLLAVVSYFCQSPQPKCYLRQLDIVGVDTKFIESHKSILKSLLDHTLPDSAINFDYDKLTEHGFEKRYGLLYEQPQIRFRLLDPQLAAEFNGVTDLSLPVDQFKQLDLLVDQVFITENKVNGLAFPNCHNAIVVFGLGYGVQTLKHVGWLAECQLYYWGDIDTHGFAILSQLRGYFPRTKSLLMDEQTLHQHQKLWVQEPIAKRCKLEQLSHLTAEESQLYHQLKTNIWQENLRLEQERISFAALHVALGNVK